MKAGDKVVCVDDSPSRCHCCFGEDVGLRNGAIYVVSSVGISQWGRPHVSLVGLGIGPKHKTVGFAIARFRLLDEMRAEAKLKAQKGMKA